MKNVIGITGNTGAGKDAICEYLKEHVANAHFLRFSQSLTDVLNIFLNEIKKEDQQWLGIVLRERFGQDILAKAVEKKANSINDGLVVLNGIRYPLEYDLLKKLNGKLIYITADAKTRWERVCQRGEKKDDNSSFEKFLELDKAPTESAITEIGKNADFIIDNSADRGALHKNIEEILKCLQIPIKESL